jgi:molecular chaperone GrpE (heat shock protein)
MNKARRKVLEEVRVQIEELKDALEAVAADEEEYKDNMPENLQGSERYSVTENAVYELQTAVEKLQEAIDGIETAAEGSE